MTDIDGCELDGRDAEIYAQALVDGASLLCGFGGADGRRADAVLCDGPTGDYWLSVSPAVARAAVIRQMERELAHARSYNGRMVGDWAEQLAAFKYAARRDDAKR